MNNILQIPAVIPNCGIKTMSDRGIRIWIDTIELSPEEMALVFKMAGKSIFVAISETDINPEDLDIEDIKAEFKTDKSPSQRLRSVTYRYWELCTNQTEKFDEFYKKQIEKIIVMIKEKLPNS